MEIFKFLFAFSLLVSLNECGNIIPLEFYTEWQNAGYVNKIVLSFTLENSIPRDHYLKLDAPLDFGTINLVLSTGNNFIALSQSKNGNSYYFTNYSFLAMQIYTMELSFSNPLTTEGILGYIGLSTISDLTPYPFVYGYNYEFSLLSTAPSPSEGTFSVTRMEIDPNFKSTFKDPDQIYEMTMFFKFGKESNNISTIINSGGSRLRAELENLNFKINNCSFVSRNCVSNSSYTCINTTIPSNSNCTPIKNGFEAVIEVPVKNNIDYSLKLVIENPGIVALSKISFYHSYRNSSILLESTKGVAFVEVEKIKPLINSIKTFNNLPLLKNGLQIYPCPIGVYQPLSSTSVPVVNNIFLDFSVDKLVKGYEIGVVLTLGKTSRMLFILEGSIYHIGFEPFANGEITCTSNYPKSSSELAIVCRGIKTLAPGGTYGIGARVYTKIYDPAQSGIDTLDGQNYPKVQLSNILSNGDQILLSDPATGYGYQYLKNYNLLSHGDANINAAVDKDNKPLIGNSWLLSYKSPSTTSPYNSATATEIQNIVCLTNLNKAYANEGAGDCSRKYQYGLFKQIKISDRGNRIVMLINPSKFAADRTWDSNHIKSTDLTVNAHVVHRFWIQKGFHNPLQKKFGFNIMGDIFTDKAQDGTKTCGKSLSDSNFCYPYYDEKDEKFIDGVTTLAHSSKNVYLVNKFDENSDYGLVTITCVIKTAGDGNCAYKSSSRTSPLNTAKYPGFELLSSDSHIIKVSKSSFYPDSKLNDLTFCMYILNYDENFSEASIFNSNPNTKLNELKIYGMLNFFHIDAPINPATVVSEMYFYNTACVENNFNGGSILSFNDGNHIPVLLRIQYKISEVQSFFNAVSISFGSLNSQGANPTLSSDQGLFSTAERGTVFNDLQPKDISQNFYKIPVSNIATTTRKVAVRGYASSGISGNFVSMDNFAWNYSPYLVFDSNEREMDFYMHVKTPGYIDTVAKCENLFHLDNVVISLLSKQSNEHSQYNIFEVYNVFSTFKYLDFGYFSSKFAQNLGDMLLLNKKMSGPNIQWNKAKLFDFSNCALSPNMYPITTNFEIGITSRLTINPGTSNANNNCKKASFQNNGYPGSGFTISVIQTIINPLWKISSIVQRNGIFIDTYRCAELNLKHPKKFLNENINMQIFICPFIGTGDIDISQNDHSFQIDLSNPVPYYAGLHTKPTPDSILTELITFAWSLNGRVPLAIGQKYANNQPSSALGKFANCKVDPYTSFYLNTLNQKASFNLMFNVSELVIPQPFQSNGNFLTTLDQKIVVEDINNLATGSITPHACDVTGEGISCDVSNSGTTLSYTISATTSTQVVIRKNNAMNINLFFSFSETTSFPTAKHTAKVYLFKSTTINAGNSEMLIADCGIVGSHIPTIAPRSKDMKLIVFKYSEYQGIYSSLSFTFEYGSGLSLWQTPVSPYVQIKTFIYFGSLWNTANTNNNVKCKVFDSKNVLSYDFQQIEVSQTTTMKAKRNLENPGLFKINCTGMYSPISNVTKVNVYAANDLQTSTNILQEIKFQPYPIKTELKFKSMNISNVKAFFASEGFDGFISFNITTSLQLSAENFIFRVGFPTSFSEKINSEGKLLECKVKNTQVPCSFYEPYFIEFPNYMLNLVNETIEISISMITFPVVTNSNKKINVFLLDENGVILESGSFDLPSISPLTNKKMIPLLDYYISSNETRVNATHTLHFNYDNSKIKNGNFLFVSFPEQFFLPNTFKICSLKNINLFTEYEFAAKCSKFDENTLKIDLVERISLANIVQNTYVMNVSEIRNPNSYNNVSFAPIIFDTKNQLSQIDATTAKGFNNFSYFIINNSPSKLKLNLVKFSDLNENQLDVTQGYFSKKYRLEIQGGTTNGLKYELPSYLSKNYKLWQDKIGSKINEITFESGSSYEEFFIANLENKMNKIEYLELNQTVFDPKIQSPSFFTLKIISKKCTIFPIADNFDIPTSIYYNTSSLPIIIDFSNCYPADKVHIQTILKSNPGGNFSMETENKTFINDYNKSSNLLVFRLNMKPNTTLDSKATVLFVINGESRFYYSMIPDTLTFKGVQGKMEERHLKPVVNSTVGKVEIKFNCSEPSDIFYAFGIGFPLINVSQIQELTIKKGVKSTIVNKNSSSAIKYGWEMQKNAQTSVIVNSIGDVKAGANYLMYSYCKKQTGRVSDVEVNSWTQAPISATVGKATILLSNEPITEHSQIILNSICKYTNSKSGSVSNYKREICNVEIKKNRILQSNGSNGSTTNFTYIVFFHPDLFQTSSNSDAKLSLLKGKTLANIGVKNVTVSSNNGGFVTSTFSYPLKSPVIDIAFSSIRPENITKNSILFTIKSDINIYFYSGIMKKNAVRPNRDQLLAGLDGNQTSLISSKIFQYIPLYTLYNFTYSGLNESTEYIFTYLTSTENVGSLDTKYSSIEFINFVTKGSGSYGTKLISAFIYGFALILILNN